MSRYRTNIKTGKVTYFKSDADKKRKIDSESKMNVNVNKKGTEWQMSGREMQNVNKSTASSKLCACCMLLG